MAKESSSLGRKRPHLSIPVELLNLDAENPRLAKEGKSDSQLDLLDIMYSDFDIEELAYSMSENGYFDEEPIVVVPLKIPKDFLLPEKVDDQQKYLQGLIDSESIQFTVVEGNRRTATLKILTDPTIRKSLGISSDFPKAVGKVLADLQKIPAIFYTERLEVTPYLGVRHISGSKKWEFYPRVYYVSLRVEEVLKRTNDYQEAFEEVKCQIAVRRPETIIKHYLYYRLTKIIESDLDYDLDPIIKNFSLIEVALRSPGIRQYIGLGDNSNFLKQIDFKGRVIPSKDLDALERILTWIYGNKKKGIQALFTDSRHIPSLGKILLNVEATDYLLRTNDYEGSYERTDGEKEMLEKKINDARKKLESAMQIAYKFKSKEFIALVDECISASEALKKMLSE